ncbi:hypothetical protein LCGC14_2196660, partial [marine sediment metagenome]
DIESLHFAFSHTVGPFPSEPSLQEVELRKTLINEETKETLEALSAGNLVDLADGIADCIVVLLGTAVAYGIDMRPVWNLIHDSNMAKIGGGKREDGKFLKPKGWTPPDIRGELIRQGWKGE